MAALTRALLAKVKARMPGAAILVYDNYNALAIGFGRVGQSGRGDPVAGGDAEMGDALLPLGRASCPIRTGC